MVNIDKIIEDEIITLTDLCVFNEVDKILQELYKRNTLVKEICFLCNTTVFYEP